MKSKKNNELLTQVNNILYETWDPIGVKRYQGSSDEYHSYAKKLVEMILEGRDSYSMEEYLTKIESGMLGIPAKEIRIKKVITKIKEIN